MGLFHFTVYNQSLREVMQELEQKLQNETMEECCFLACLQNHV